MTGRPGDGPAPLLHRALLALHARAFREEYGADLLATLARVRDEPRHRGLLGTARFAAHVLPDLLATAIRSRGRALRSLAPRPDAMLQDLRWALRSLRKNPGFTTAALLTLALGIGAATAVFTVVNGVLLRPLPYHEPDRVAMVWSSWVDFPDRTWVSVDEYRHYATRARSFESLALWQESTANVGGADEPERVRLASVTTNLFDVLGVAPVVGRVFTEDEGLADAPVVVLGHGLWTRRYGGDSGVVGRAVDVSGTMRTVVGVLPEDFRLPTDYREGSATQVFLPGAVDLDPALPVPQHGGSHGSQVVGRLAEGATLRSARAELEGIAAALTAEGVYLEEWSFQPRVFGVTEDVLRTTRPALLVLLGAVGLVLLIACGNVANLLLARGERRTGEWAVRAALGAGRGRIARQVLTEGVVLALAGGAAGLAAATLGLDALLALDPGSLPRADDVRVDGRVAAFAGALSLLAVALFAVVPAVRAGGGRMFAALREGGGGGGGRSASGRLRRVLVASQAAMAVLLLTASALTARTFLNLVRIDPGFRAEDVLTLRLSLPSSSYGTPSEVAGFYDGLLARVRALPGVERAAVVRQLPLASTIGDAGMQVEGYTPAPGETVRGDWQVVSEDYFETLGIPVAAGRVFEARDDASSDLLVINEAMARRYWSGRDPLGTRAFAMGDTVTVIGVVGDVAHNGLTAPIKEKFYRLQRQVPQSWIGSTRSMTVAVATRGEPYAVLPAVRSAVAALDPQLPVAEVRSLDEVRGAASGESRFTMALLGLFAAVALALSVIGVYGVLSYMVGLRTREIGLRMALGAASGSVVGMVVRQGMGMALAGVAAGVALSWAAGRSLEALLWGVTGTDPLTLVAVPVGFALVALAACWLPARRAARVNPVRALKAE